MAGDADRMEVAFDATADDLYGVLLTARHRNPVVRRGWWGEVAVLVGFPVVMYLVRVRRDGWERALAVAAVTAGILVLIGVVRRVATRQKVRALCRVMLADAETFRVEIALGPDGVWVRSLGVAQVVPWNLVTGVDVTERWVDIRFDVMHLVRAQDRAFTSAVDRERYIALARRYARGPDTTGDA